MKSRVASLILIASGIGVAADVPLSLQNLAERELDDAVAGDGKGGWTDEGPENSLHSLPRDRQIFGGISFDIPTDSPPVLALAGRAWPQAPAEVTVSADGAMGNTLFVLSAHAWEDEPTELAGLIVRYRNGEEDHFRLIFETQTGSWWYPVSRPEAKVVWRDKTRAGIPVGVYLAGFPLSLPKEPVESIRIRGSAPRGQLLILGLSVSDKPASLARPGPAWVDEPFEMARWFSPALACEGLPVWSAPVERKPTTGRMLIMELGSSLSAPTPAEAETLTGLLREIGYTGIRTAPLDPLVAATSPDSQRNGMQTLLAACREKGLDVSVTLAGGRRYQSEEGIAAFRDLHPGYPEHLFIDPAATYVLERDLGRFWKPAQPFPDRLAPSAILFEGGLFSYHFEALTRPHRRMLQNRWNAWLKAKYGSEEALKSAWQVADQASPLLPQDQLERSRVDLFEISQLLAASPRFRRRVADQLRFLDEVQGEWFEQRAGFARALFPKTTWSATAWTSPGWLRDFQTRVASRLDSIEERAELLETGSFSEAGRPLYLDLSPLSESSIRSFTAPFQRVEDRPFLVWDAIGVWPGDKNFVRVLRTMTVGAIQGWTGILHRRLDRLPAESAAMTDQPLPGAALQNPSVLATLPLGRNLFLRGDLPEASTAFFRDLLTPEDVASPTVSPPAGGNGFSGELAFRTRVFARTGPGDSSRQTAEAPTAPNPETEKSLELDPRKDLLIIRTAASLALAGTLNQKAAISSAASLQPGDGYGIFYLTSLDDRPIAQSRRLLIGLVGRSRNSGQTTERSTEPRGMHEVAWSVRNPGTAPVVMEPLSGLITIPNAETGTWSLQAVDVRGRLLPGTRRSFDSQPGKGLILNLDTGSFRSPLFLLTHD